MKVRKLPSFERIMIFTGLLSFGLLLYRCIFAENFHYTFLLWNLLLTFLPYIISKKLIKTEHNSFASFLLLFGWLVFFPACIYPLTDLFQMHGTGDFSVAYDVMMFISFAIAGFLPGLLSLRNVERFLKGHTSGFLTKLSVGFFIFLSSYSACLVKFLHLNSWNVIADFKRMLIASERNIADPADHTYMWTFIIVLVLSIDVMYAGFKKLTVKTARISSK